jgi:hypothetical protein
MRRIIARADAKPHCWDVGIVAGGCRFSLDIAEARDLRNELDAAIVTAEAEVAREATLPIDERVWLYLARLNWWTTEGIVRDLDVPEASVCAAMDRLRASGRATSTDGVWFAVGDRSRARIPQSGGSHE